MRNQGNRAQLGGIEEHPAEIEEDSGLGMGLGGPSVDPLSEAPEPCGDLFGAGEASDMQGSGTGS